MAVVNRLLYGIGGVRRWWSEGCGKQVWVVVGAVGVGMGDVVGCAENALFGGRPRL